MTQLHATRAGVVPASDGASTMATARLPGSPVPPAPWSPTAARSATRARP